MKILLTHTPHMRDNYYGARALAGLQALGDVVLNQGRETLEGPALIAAAQGCDLIVADRATALPGRIFDGLASLRVGYGYSGPGMASLLDRVRQPFNVNAIGQAAAVAALGDREFTRACALENRRGIRRLEAGFGDLGLEFIPSQANFVLVRVGDGAGVFDALQRRGVIVRPLKIYSLPEWVRVTVGTPAQNERLLGELAAVLRRSG